MRGKLIVFEGLDRSGKSTQCARLAAKLAAAGHRVRHARFPDRTTATGRLINDYLTGGAEVEDHVIHLLFSANRWEAAETIRKDIDAGTTVLLDRYYYSGIVYSAAKQNPSLPLRWARQPEEGLPRPDVCVFMDIAPEAAAARGGFGEEKYETSLMQQLVRELYGELLAMPQEKEDFVRVDGGSAVEVVEERVWEGVMGAWRRVEEEGGPLRAVLPW